MGTAAGPQPMSAHARAVVLLLGAMIFINYVDRGNLATAGPLIKTELGLSNTAFGLLVSAFFWTYVPAQLLAGWLSQRFCAYRVLAAGLAIWALATIATAFAHGFAMLLALRLLLGLGESAAFPASSKLFADHLPPDRYGHGNGATAIGLSFGPAFGIYAGGLAMAAWGWRVSFIIFGAASLLWLIPWLMLDRGAARVHAASGPGPSLGDIMRQPRAWWAAIGHFTNNYGFYFLLAWLPLYLVRTHGFTLAQMATLGGAIYLLQGVTAMGGGMIADRWISNGMSTDTARKAFLIASNGLVMLCMAAAGLGNAPVAIGALVLSGIGSGLGASCIFATGQTLAGPGAAGKWIGFQNFIGNLSGIVGPALTGYLVDHAGGFPAAFAVAALVGLVGLLVWAFFIGRIEPVAWPDRQAKPARAD